MDKWAGVTWLRHKPGEHPSKEWGTEEEEGFGPLSSWEEMGLGKAGAHPETDDLLEFVHFEKSLIR